MYEKRLWLTTSQKKRNSYKRYRKWRQIGELFKKRRGIKLSYNKQGLIYFICMNIKELPAEVQDKVLNLCLAIAGEDYRALYEVLTCDFRTVEAIAGKHYISEKKLYGYRKEFYEKFSWNFSS